MLPEHYKKKYTGNNPYLDDETFQSVNITVSKVLQTVSFEQHDSNSIKNTVRIDYKTFMKIIEDLYKNKIIKDKHNVD